MGRQQQQILVRRETELEAKARGAVHMDDLDLVISPRDGALVAVAMKNLDGTSPQHVCWRCGGAFNEADPKLRRTEVKWGYSRIMLHAQCEKGAPRRMYQNNLEGMQYRRKLAETARKSQSIAAAAAESKKRIITTSR